jgi:UDP-N-acetylmuramyl tripeptide synthase
VHRDRSKEKSSNEIFVVDDNPRLQNPRKIGVRIIVSRGCKGSKQSDEERSAAIFFATRMVRSFILYIGPSSST